MGLLWQPSVVRVYLDLLLECSNPETLEGAAGTLQNLTAPNWEPAQVLVCPSVRISVCLFILLSISSNLLTNLAKLFQIPTLLVQLLRETVRRDKGLSVITSLLRMSNDSVVRSTAVCLRNLATDSKNKELLGKWRDCSPASL